MNNIKIKLLIQAAREQYPELRLGQLLTDAAKAGGWKNQDIFYCPDDVIADGLKKMLDLHNSKEELL